jgi:2'-5' RNA ligase
MKLSIISYLDPDSHVKVVQLQQKLRDITSSTSALQTWQPHITIGDGIEVSSKRLALLEAILMQIARKHRPFTVTLCGFDGFTNWQPGTGHTGTSYVIYVHVVPNEALLKLVQDIREAVSNESRWYTMPTPYSPHITLAYRDLDEAGYRRALAYLQTQSLDRTMTIDHIALAVSQDDSNEQLQRIMLSDSPI